MRLTRNEIKISFKKQGFIVNQEKGEIFCRLHFKVLLPIDYDSEVIFKEVPRTYVDSVAKCAPEDTFDEKIGKKIALAKAENRAYELVSNYAKKVKICSEGHYNNVKNSAVAGSIVRSFRNKANLCIEHNIRYIDSLTEK